MKRYGGTLRRELLDHVIVFNEEHLKRLLKDFIEEYYHLARPHHGLDLKGDTTKGFTPEEDLRVYKGDKISFELETTPTILNAKFEIIMDEPSFFSRQRVTDSTETEVIAALQKRTTYQCNFIGADGEPLF